MFNINPNIAIINPDVTCCKCLEEKQIKQIYIPSKGYGSGFDGWSTQINLCDSCFSNTNSEWWELRDAENKHGDDWYGDVPYEYEDDIFTYLKNLTPAGKEMVWNKYASDSYWEPQDYIDYEIGILPHDKCKEYSVYSHQEINAYEERFPTCQHPFNLVWDVDSKSCYCPFGAHGEYGQSTGANVSDECYGCQHYVERTTPIKDIKNEDHDNYKIYYQAKLQQEEFKSKFE